MNDVVYILKRGQRSCNVDLRYSLRSLKNIPHGQVFFIGWMPEWVKNATLIEAEDPYPIKAQNALHKILIACKDKRISDDFILFNDDFYILKKIKDIPYYAKGPFTDSIRNYKERYNGSKYITLMEKTASLFKDAYDYGIHCPIVYNKKKFVALDKIYDLKQGYLLRSVYCNHYKLKPVIMEDCKIMQLSEMYDLEGSEKLLNMKFLSSSDDFSAKPAFTRYMDFFFNGMSKYERTAHE